MTGSQEGLAVELLTQCQLITAYSARLPAVQEQLSSKLYFVDTFYKVSPQAASFIFRWVYPDQCNQWFDDETRKTIIEQAEVDEDQRGQLDDIDLVWQLSESEYERDSYKLSAHEISLLVCGIITPHNWSWLSTNNKHKLLVVYGLDNVDNSPIDNPTTSQTASQSTASMPNQAEAVALHKLLSLQAMAAEEAYLFYPNSLVNIMIDSIIALSWSRHTHQGTIVVVTQ